MIILKLKKYAIKKLPYPLRYVPDYYKTQQIWCNKAIIENGGTLKSIPDCYKNQEICKKVVDSYPHSLEFIPECHKIKKCKIKLLIPIHLQKNLFLNGL